MTYRAAFMTGAPVIALLALGAISAAAQKVPESTWDGVFTEAQAERGKAAYAANCAGCHGVGLIAKRGGEPTSLTGQDFEFNWYNQTVAERFERIRTTMPPAAKGSLSG